MVRLPLVLRFLAAAMLVVIAVPALASGRLTITVEDARATVGSHVVVEVEGRALEDPPDLAPLFAEADAAGVTTGTRLAVINGALVELRSWRILLVPRKPGPITLGPLHAGDVESNSVTLDVRPRQVWAPDPADLVASLSLDPPRPYVGQATRLVVTLRSSVRTEALDIAPPMPDGLRLRSLSSPATRPNPAGGWLTEATWLLVPMASGSVAAAPGRLTAVALSAEGDRAAVDRPLALPVMDVRPWPAGAPQPWLPARAVGLSETWSVEPSTLRAGDLTVRTLTLEATGVEAAELADPVFAPTRGLSILPHAPERETTFGPDGPLARLVQRFDIRALSPTPVFLDTIRVPWWDVAADRAREAVLPARRFDVAPPDAERLAAMDKRTGIATAALWASLALLGGAAAVVLGWLVARLRARAQEGGDAIRLPDTSDAARLYAALVALPPAVKRRAEIRDALARLEASLYANPPAPGPDLRALRRSLARGVRSSARNQAKALPGL
jgi:hypothetical protein